MAYDKRSETWEDKTERVESIHLDPSKGYRLYAVRYTGAKKIYLYRQDSIYYDDNPSEVNISGKTVYANDELLLYVKRIVQFGSYHRIYFDDGKTTLTKSLKLLDLSQDTYASVYGYYKALAFRASTNNEEEDRVENYINKQYRSIDRISQASALKAFVTGEGKTYDTKDVPIFPFPFNLSQKKAIINAMGNQVSVIEGPPGCGKTQTILNLLMNLVTKKMTAAVVSNNNTAIRNIRDKLEEENLSFLSALLGNRDNKKDFFDSLEEDRTRNVFIGSYDHNENEKSIEYSFNEQIGLLDFLHTEQNKQARLNVLLEKLIQEYEHFKARFTQELETVKENKTVSTYSSTKALKLKAFLESGRKRTWVTRLILHFRFRIKIHENEDINGLILQLEDRFYSARIKEIRAESTIIGKTLAKNRFDDVKKRYESESRKKLNRYLYKTYARSDQAPFTYKSYREEFDRFIKRYPIILSTAHSLLSSIGTGYMFDYLIVDEASQSDLLTSVLAMTAAKNIVVVGDSKQLEQITNQELDHPSRVLAEAYRIPESYAYPDHSLLSAIKGTCPKAPVTLLKEHYRCHPIIIDYVNQKYYDNELIIHTRSTDESPIRLVKLVEGNHARRNPNGTGQYNQREIDEVRGLIEQSEFQDIGIISPFKVQADMIRQALESDNRVESDTVHKFQGRQKQAIVISTVVNAIERSKYNERLINFIDNPKLFNVALSRAIHQVTLVGTHGLFQSGNNNFSDFIKYATWHERPSTITTGKVVSVFDILYAEYREQAAKFMKKHERKDLIISEAIVLEVIKEILAHYGNLNVAMHVSVNKIVSDFSIFSTEERRYLENNWTHVDFLIYNALTKESIMAVEVDGIKYHEQSELQSMRDRIKDKAFGSQGIDLMRIKTNESDVQGRIRESLNSAMSV